MQETILLDYTHIYIYTAHHRFGDYMKVLVQSSFFYSKCSNEVESVLLDKSEIVFFLIYRFIAEEKYLT